MIECAIALPRRLQWPAQSAQSYSDIMCARYLSSNVRSCKTGQPYVPAM